MSGPNVGFHVGFHVGFLVGSSGLPDNSWPFVTNDLHVFFRVCRVYRTGESPKELNPAISARDGLE
jgi:hypothetical protein